MGYRWLHKSPVLIYSLLLLLILLDSYQCMIKIPWGPYVVPRSVKRSNHLLYDSSDADNLLPSCCPEGFKSEYLPDKNTGNEYLHHHCPQEMFCCSGLKEIPRKNFDGSSYSICQRIKNYPYDERIDYQTITRYLGMHKKKRK